MCTLACFSVTRQVPSSALALGLGEPNGVRGVFLEASENGEVIGHVLGAALPCEACEVERSGAVCSDPVRNPVQLPGVDDRSVAG